MKARILFALPLAATLMIPAAAQQTTSDTQPTSQAQSNTQSQTTTSNGNTTTTTDVNSDQNLSARQPLQPEMRQGFWGKMNPFARKKYVQRQLSPIRNRVNELDDLTAENARQIKDVDSRAQEGIRQADAKATQADQHAVDAGNRAQQANETATQASTRLNTVEQVVGNIDQYQAANTTEIRFRSGQTALGAKSKEALDDMTQNLNEQKGYLIEVQGFSPSGVQASQAMANSVVRYLVTKQNVPVYRIRTIGLGNAKIATNDGETSHARGNRVEVTLLKNNVDQLASNSVPASTNSNNTYRSGSYSNNNSGSYSNSGNNNGSYSNTTTTSQPSYSQPANQQPSTNQAPATSTPQQ